MDSQRDLNLEELLDLNNLSCDIDGIRDALLAAPERVKRKFYGLLTDNYEGDSLRPCSIKEQLRNRFLELRVRLTPKSVINAYGLLAGVSDKLSSLGLAEQKLRKLYSWACDKHNNLVDYNKRVESELRELNNPASDEYKRCLTNAVRNSFEEVALNLANNYLSENGYTSGSATFHGGLLILTVPPPPEYVPPKMASNACFVNEIVHDAFTAIRFGTVNDNSLLGSCVVRKFSTVLRRDGDALPQVELPGLDGITCSYIAKAHF